MATWPHNVMTVTATAMLSSAPRVVTIRLSELFSAAYTGSADSVWNAVATTGNRTINAGENLVGEVAVPQQYGEQGGAGEVGGEVD